MSHGSTEHPDFLELTFHALRCIRAKREGRGCYKSPGPSSSRCAPILERRFSTSRRTLQGGPSRRVHLLCWPLQTIVSRRYILVGRYGGAFLSGVWCNPHA